MSPIPSDIGGGEARGTPASNEIRPRDERRDPPALDSHASLKQWRVAIAKAKAATTRDGLVGWTEADRAAFLRRAQQEGNR